MCGNVGAVDKEKTSLHVSNVPETAFPLAKPGPNFQGRTIFPLKISVRGDQNFQDQNSGDRATSVSLLAASLVQMAQAVPEQV